MKRIVLLKMLLLIEYIDLIIDIIKAEDDSMIFRNSARLAVGYQDTEPTPDFAELR